MVPFLCHFHKLQLVKNFELIFDALYFYIYELKKVSHIFKIFFQIGDIDNLSFVVFLFIVQNYTENADGDVFNSRKCDTLSFLEFKVNQLR